MQEGSIYYEGLFEDVDSLLDQHKLATVTTFGTRRSRKNQTTKAEWEDKDSISGKVLIITSYYN